MLKHAKASLHLARRDELEAERNKAIMEFRVGLAALLDVFNTPRHLRALLDTVEHVGAKTVDGRPAALEERQ